MGQYSAVVGARSVPSTAASAGSVMVTRGREPVSHRPSPQWSVLHWGRGIAGTVWLLAWGVRLAGLCYRGFAACRIWAASYAPCTAGAVMPVPRDLEVRVAWLVLECAAPCVKVQRSYCWGRLAHSFGGCAARSSAWCTGFAAFVSALSCWYRSGGCFMRVRCPARGTGIRGLFGELDIDGAAPSSFLPGSLGGFLADWAERTRASSAPSDFGVSAGPAFPVLWQCRGQVCCGESWCQSGDIGGQCALGRCRYLGRVGVGLDAELGCWWCRCLRHSGPSAQS